MPDGAAPPKLDAGVADLLTLKGRAAVVVGGTGPSLGRSCAHRLASLGADLVLVGRGSERGEFVASEVRDRWGVSVFFVSGDVMDPHDAGRVVDAASEALGRIDLLVHNAGGVTVNGVNRAGPFTKVGWDDIDALIDLNLSSVLNVARPVARGMAARGSGKLIFVSSEAGKSGMPNNAAYAASKAAVMAFTRRLAVELKPDGVVVLSVSPGTMLTEELIEKLKRVPATGNQLAYVKGSSRITLGRCSRPDEVASVIAYLATSAGNGLSGATISVGGGMSD